MKEGFIIRLVCSHGGCCFTLALFVLLVMSQVPSQRFFVNLSMKQGSLFVLFCLYLWDPPNLDASDPILGLFGKLRRRRRDAWAWWLHDVWTCGAKVLEYWMFFSLQINLNRSWKFRRNWNVPLVFLERSWWAGFNGIYLVRFGFRFLSDFCRWKFK